MSIQKIKGSKDYYSVDLDKLTCTCKDFTCRRHNYSINDPNRLCKHIKEALELNKLKPACNITSLNKKVFNRSEVSLFLNNYIIPILKKDNNILKFDVVGDYRRGLQEINELIIVIRVIYKEISTLLGSLFSKLFSDNYKEIYKSDNGLNIEVVKVDDNSYPFKVFDLTGNWEFLVMIKSVSRKLGLELNECGFTKNEILLDTDIGNESEIFEYLGINYVDPKYRK